MHVPCGQQVAGKQTLLVEHTWKESSTKGGACHGRLPAKDAETGNRGYLITGDEAYLQPYNDALRDLPIEVATFRSLTSDNPIQQRRIGEMQAVLEQRLALLKEGNDLRRSGNADAIHILVISGTGKLQICGPPPRARQRKAMHPEADEHRLLAERTHDAQSNGTRSRYAVVIASGLDFLLIVFMFRFLSKERSLRIAGEITAYRLAASRAELVQRNEEINALNTTLEQRVQLRTAELEATNRELEAFSYSVSHDLRAPLRTIDGFSLALEEDYSKAVDDTGRDYIRRVRTTACSTHGRTHRSCSILPHQPRRDHPPDLQHQRSRKLCRLGTG